MSTLPSSTPTSAHASALSADRGEERDTRTWREGDDGEGGEGPGELLV